MSIVVVNTSALVAILLVEPEAQDFEDLLSRAGTVLMSEVNRFELSVVMLGPRGAGGVGEATALIDLIGIQTKVFDAVQSAAATAAYARYGKGIHPRARLDLADCAAYALANTLGVPLLFKGDDFAATDILAAV